MLDSRTDPCLNLVTAAFNNPYNENSEGCIIFILCVFL